MKDFMANLTFWKFLGIVILIGVLGTFIVRVIVAVKKGEDSLTWTPPIPPQNVAQVRPVNMPKP